MRSCCVDYFFSRSVADRWAHSLQRGARQSAPLTGKSTGDSTLLDNEERGLPIGVVNRNMKKNARHKKVARLRSC